MPQKTTKQMNDALAHAGVAVPTFTQWLHYKGGIYAILGYVINTEDGELMVRYRRLDGPGFNTLAEAEIEYARPIKEWHENVSTASGLVPRFEQVKKVEMWKLKNSKDKSIVVR